MYKQFDNQNAWLKNAEVWKTYEPPIKPSAAELLIYDLVASSKAGEPFSSRALVLGVSAELRDLLAEHQFKTTVVANDVNTIIAMKQLLTYTGEKKEKVVVTDWQQMDFGEKKFDLVVSDWGLNSLSSWREYTVVFDRVDKLLAPEGMFVIRLNVFNPDEKIKKVKEIMKEYKINPKQKFSFLMQMEMYSEITTYNKETYQINLGKFYRDKITEAYHDGKMTFEEWQDFYFPFFTVTLTYPDKYAMEKLLRSFFDVSAIRYGGDYLFSENEPIYVCKKKAK